MCGHLVLIDEPELSLHPAWRSHILHYYQSLFADDGGQLGAQLFVTTHSPRVIEAGFAQKSTLILVLRRQGEQINAHHIQHTPALPTLSIAETNYLAFHLISVDYHVGLYSCMQAKFALTSITQADKFIATHAAFDPQKHSCRDRFSDSDFHTLPTYIRNSINHPESGRKYSQSQLETSIQLLRAICRASI